LIDIADFFTPFDPVMLTRDDSAISEILVQAFIQNLIDRLLFPELLTPMMATKILRGI
jgi:hypothetical protein